MKLAPMILRMLLTLVFSLATLNAQDLVFAEGSEWEIVSDGH